MITYPLPSIIALCTSLKQNSNHEITNWNREDPIPTVVVMIRSQHF